MMASCKPARLPPQQAHLAIGHHKNWLELLSIAIVMLFCWGGGRENAIYSLVTVACLSPPSGPTNKPSLEQMPPFQRHRPTAQPHTARQRGGRPSIRLRAEQAFLALWVLPSSYWWEQVPIIQHNPPSLTSLSLETSWFRSEKSWLLSGWPVNISVWICRGGLLNLIASFHPMWWCVTGQLTPWVSQGVLNKCFLTERRLKLPVIHQRPWRVNGSGLYYGAAGVLISSLGHHLPLATDRGVRGLWKELQPGREAFASLGCPRSLWPWNTNSSVGQPQLLHLERGTVNTKSGGAGNVWSFQEACHRDTNPVLLPKASTPPQTTSPSKKAALVLPMALKGKWNKMLKRSVSSPTISLGSPPIMEHTLHLPSQVTPWAPSHSSTASPGGPVRNAESRAPFHPCWVRMCSPTSSPGDADVF